MPKIRNWNKTDERGTTHSWKAEDGTELKIIELSSGAAEIMGGKYRLTINPPGYTPNIAHYDTVEEAREDAVDIMKSNPNIAETGQVQ